MLPYQFTSQTCGQPNEQTLQMKCQGFHKNYFYCFWCLAEDYVHHTWSPSHREDLSQKNDWPHGSYGCLSSLSWDVSAFEGWSKSFMITTSMENMLTKTIIPNWHGWTPSLVQYKPANRSHWRSTWLQHRPFCQKRDTDKQRTHIWGLRGTLRLWNRKTVWWRSVLLRHNIQKHMDTWQKCLNTTKVLYQISEKSHGLEDAKKQQSAIRKCREMFKYLKQSSRQSLLSVKEWYDG